MQKTTHHQDDPEYVFIPLDVQIAITLDLYAQWQKCLPQHINGFISFEDWLKKILTPHPLELLDPDPISFHAPSAPDIPNIIDDDRVFVQDFHFAEVEWHWDWLVGASSVIGDRYASFEVSIGFCTLVWLTKLG